MGAEKGGPESQGTPGLLSRGAGHCRTKVPLNMSVTDAIFRGAAGALNPRWKTHTSRHTRPANPTPKTRKRNAALKATFRRVTGRLKAAPLLALSPET